jgi:hypothetical protein
MAEMKANANSLYLMVGAPASGKSTFSILDAEKKRAIRLSSDELRATIGKNEEDQTVTGKVFDFIKAAVKYFLRGGFSVIVDATNINKKNRADYLRIATELNVSAVAVCFEVPVEELKKRNSERARQVPEWVIDRFVNSYERPTLSEGFSRIEMR